MNIALLTNPKVQVKIKVKELNLLPIKMKVLHIAGGFPSNKLPHQQPFIKSQVDSLIREGIEVEIFDIKGYESTMNYLKAIPRIRKAIDKNRIDIIHAHYSYCGLAAILAKINIPIVLSLMGNDLLGTPNHKGHQTIRGRADIVLSKVVIRLVDHVIVKSERMKNLIKTNISCSILPNGVNFDIFKPHDQIEARRKLKLDENKFIVLFLGDKNITVKNFPLAHNAFLRFKDQSDCLFINPFGIPPNLVVDYMNASDVLLLTSYFEGSPNVIKEAMACNLPIISVDVGDVKEIIANTANCFIVGFKEDEIVDKLKIISRNRCRSNGRRNIEHLKDSQIAVKLIKIYSNILVKSR